MTSIFELKIEEMPSGDPYATIVIDGTPFGNCCIDLDALRKSAIVSGGYDIQTCGCGVPWDANFWEPIFVQHDGDVIRWEYDERYHPVPIEEALFPLEEEDEHTKLTIGRYEFDRLQYITEIRQKFAWLRTHPGRSELGPYGFDSVILDKEFPDTSLPPRPFSQGGKYRGWIRRCE